MTSGCSEGSFGLIPRDLALSNLKVNDTLGAAKIVACSATVAVLDSQTIRTEALTSDSVAFNTLIAGGTTTDTMTAGAITTDTLTAGTTTTNTLTAGVITTDTLTAGATTTTTLTAGATTTDTLTADAIVTGTITATTFVGLPAATMLNLGQTYELSANFVSPGLFWDAQAGYGTSVNQIQRFQLPVDITRLTVLMQKITGASAGNMSMEVLEEDRTTPIAGVSSTLALGNANPLWGTVTYTFTAPLLANTTFTVRFISTISASIELKATMYSS